MGYPLLFHCNKGPSSYIQMAWIENINWLYLLCVGRIGLLLAQWIPNCGTGSSLGTGVVFVSFRYNLIYVLVLFWISPGVDAHSLVLYIKAAEDTAEKHWDKCDGLN